MLATVLLALAFAGEPVGLPALGPGQRGVVVTVARAVTLDGSDRVVERAMLVAVDGKLVHVGPHVDVPTGYERIDRPGTWAVPGMIDLHSHVVAGGFGDLNDMVLPIGPELRSAPGIVPGNESMRAALASGVTTLFLIPGSGTSMSGFGTLFKTRVRGARYERAVFADPGGMKVAQTHNPERRGGDLGQTRAGLAWLLERANDRAIAANADGREEFGLANLQRVHRKELPVLVHCAGSDGTAATVRMWREHYDTRSVLSHGCLGGHRVAAYVGRVGMPVNLGPRTQDWFVSRTGAIEPMALAYWSAGSPDFSVNTDAPVMPQHELFLQASVSARQGVPSSQALRALSLHPARAFGIDGRLGSLEPGKDADIVLFSGDPLDPRSFVQSVLIEGDLEYDHTRDGRWF
jgi:imidazolonepropionase-like amidohydrolase